MLFYHKKKDQGFSLVELMVAVGIMGAMSSLAVPQYQKFRANAAQSEAKSSLSSIYTLQQLYFTEHSYYASINIKYNNDDVAEKLRDNDQLGYLPTSNARYIYKGDRFKFNGRDKVNKGDRSDTQLEAVRFRAMANSVSTLASCSLNDKDRWCMNENKMFFNNGEDDDVALPCKRGHSKRGGCG